MTPVRAPRLTLLLVALLACALLGAPAAGAETATWALEQPAAPPPPPGVAPAPAPVALGTIGGMAFWEPAEGAPQANRGLLIVHGNGTAVPPGVWAYNGVHWHEIAQVCGATEGSVAWSGPEEFWTVSDGRPGQSAKNAGTEFEEAVPLANNTLCRFAEGRVIDSYAHLAFQPDSYREMHAAACVPPAPPAASSPECWFGGALPQPPEVGGSFHLYWNGTALEEHPDPEGHRVREMRQFEGGILESVEVLDSDAEEGGSPPVVHSIAGGTILPETGVPLYGPSEPPQALEGLRLSNTQSALWAGAGPSGQHLEPFQKPGQVTVARRVAGIWEQVLGPRNPLPEVFSGEAEALALTGAPRASEAQVTAVAAEPDGTTAWIALGPAGASREQGRSAALVHIDSEGHILGTVTLPTAEERAHGVGPTGSAVRLECPGVEDCWMATSEGWLYHLANAGERAAAAAGESRSELSSFKEGAVISERPRDQGIPEEVVEAPPADTSGINEEHEIATGKIAETKPSNENKVYLPLMSNVTDHLRKGNVLELRFHLSVKARVQLLAKRRGKVIAKSANRTFKAGNRSLSVQLNPRAWPDKLSLKTKALEKLRLVSSVTGPGSNIGTVSTGFHVFAPLSPLFRTGFLP